MYGKFLFAAPASIPAKAVPAKPAAPAAKKPAPEGRDGSTPSAVSYEDCTGECNQAGWTCTKKVNGIKVDFGICECSSDSDCVYLCTGCPSCGEPRGCPNGESYEDCVVGCTTESCVPF